MATCLGVVVSSLAPPLCRVHADVNPKQTRPTTPASRAQHPPFLDSIRVEQTFEHLVTQLSRMGAYGLSDVAMVGEPNLGGLCHNRPIPSPPLHPHRDTESRNTFVGLARCLNLGSWKASTWCTAALLQILTGLAMNHRTIIRRHARGRSPYLHNMLCNDFIFLSSWNTTLQPPRGVPVRLLNAGTCPVVHHDMTLTG